MESVNNFPLCPIEYMRLNRYSGGKHKTMFKNKINCKIFYEHIKSKSNSKDLYLYFNRSEYNFISKLDKESPEYNKFIFVLSENDQVCIKIGNDKLLREYENSKTLEKLNIPVFITQYCILQCKDNLCIDEKTHFLDVIRVLNEYPSINNIYAERFPDEKDTPVNILVMPYIKYGEFSLYNWTTDSLHIFKNCLKHIIMTLLYASFKLEFIHSYGYNENGELRDGNLLLGKTDLKSISYGEFGTLEIIDGYMPFINDCHNGGFINYEKLIIENTANIENSENINKNNKIYNHDWMIYLQIETIINLSTIRSECCLSCVSTIDCIQSIRELYNFPDCSKGVTIKQISKEVCDIICNAIDKINVYV